MSLNVRPRKRQSDRLFFSTRLRIPTRDGPISELTLFRVYPLVITAGGCINAAEAAWKRLSRGAAAVYSKRTAASNVYTRTRVRYGAREKLLILICAVDLSSGFLLVVLHCASRRRRYRGKLEEASRRAQ